MTFEGFDAAPLIEAGGFMPAMPAMGEAGAPDAATLDAALREAARAEMRAEASILDLWVERPGASTFRVLEGPAFTAGTSRHAWAVMAGDDGALIFPPNGNDTALRASFGDDDWDEDEGILVVGPSGSAGGDNIGGPGAGNYPGGPEGPGIGEGGMGNNLDQPTEDAKDTPCVNEIPAGVDKEHLNDLAKAAGTRLGALQDATGWEWGAVIYKDANGQLWVSDPFTARSSDSISGATFRIPAGSHIVGYIHTHPIDLNMDQRTLSAADRQFINTLTNLSGRVTADPNLLAYVTTKDGSSFEFSNTYSTYVYDKSERNRTSPGCDL